MTSPTSELRQREPPRPAAPASSTKRPVSIGTGFLRLGLPDALVIGSAPGNRAEKG